jgi:hypothetical protein
MCSTCAFVGLLCAVAETSVASSITEPPCTGAGGIAYYAGPPLPVTKGDDGWYESNPTYTVPPQDGGAWAVASPASQGLSKPICAPASVG